MQRLSPFPQTILTAALLFAWGVGGEALAKEPRKPGPYFIAGDFRIFYTLEGKSAIPAEDHDGSGVPDRVEDVAQQLLAAQRMYCGVLGFTDPLKSQRYAEATCIQVVLRSSSGNGTAYNGLGKARKIPEGQPEDRALTIAIGSHVDPIKNVTPAHEYFHLIQYGSTYFKNRWFLEGMARWAEHAISAGDLGQVAYAHEGPWPQDERQLEELFQLAYDAEHTLWNPIAMATDPKDALPRTDEIRELAAMRYSDGSTVLADLNLRGVAVMREILVELGKQDKVAYEALGYESWGGGNQSSQENNPYIYQAVMNVLRRHGLDVGEYAAQ